MFAMLGILLVILGLCGIIGLISTGIAGGIVLLVVGLVFIAFDRRGSIGL